MDLNVFLQQMPVNNDINLQNPGTQSNIFPIHGLQHAGSQATFSSIYSNIIPPNAAQNNPTTQSLADQWYYEDPEVNIFSIVFYLGQNLANIFIYLYTLTLCEYCGYLRVLLML